MFWRTGDPAEAGSLFPNSWELWEVSVSILKTPALARPEELTRLWSSGILFVVDVMAPAHRGEGRPSILRDLAIARQRSQNLQKTSSFSLRKAHQVCIQRTTKEGIIPPPLSVPAPLNWLPKSRGVCLLDPLWIPTLHKPDPKKRLVSFLRSVNRLPYQTGNPESLHVCCPLPPRGGTRNFSRV
jgi:hypothetical protein